MIDMKNVSFRYPKAERYILKNADVKFEKGKLYAIMGPSGSGKTTFLSLLSGLELPTEGKILINKSEVSRDTIQREKIAYIFQNYQLFPYLSAIENVAVALQIRGVKNKEINPLAIEYLREVGITGKELTRRAAKLSGGEQQRVGIARALAIQSEYILADEPTGNLDTLNAQIVIQKLLEIAHEKNCCVIVVTHSDQIKDRADIVYKLDDGFLQLFKG